MSSNMILLISILAFSSVIVLVTMVKSGHFISYLILSALSGIGSLFAVNLLSSITGVTIALNYITLSVSSLFGISGVIGLLLTF